MSEAAIVAAVQALVEEAVEYVVVVAGANKLITWAGEMLAPLADYFRAVTLTPGTYSLAGLASALQTALNAAWVGFAPYGVPAAVTWSVTVSSAPGFRTLRFAVTGDVSADVQWILPFDPAEVFPVVGSTTLPAASCGFTAARHGFTWDPATPAWTEIGDVALPCPVQVHEDLQWAGTEQAFDDLFLDATEDVVHAWMVTRTGYDEKIVGCNNLSIGTHAIKVFGLYGVRDVAGVPGPSPMSGLDGPAFGAALHNSKATSSIADWRPIKAAVMQTLRTHYTLDGTVMSCGPPQIVGEDYRSFQWKLVHWVEIDLPTRERVSYLEV
jgi:hypothetical protein